MSRWLKTPTKRRKACIAPPCLLETLDTDTQDFKQIINDISGTGIILFTHTCSYIVPNGVYLAVSYSLTINGITIDKANLRLKVHGPGA